MARILIVEDEPLISMMLDEWLGEIGHTPVGPAASVTQALALIQAEKFNAAILDLNLRGQRADGVADALAQKLVPFAFATGDAAQSLAPRFASQPVVSKPYDFDEVKNAVAALIGGGRAAA